MAVAEMVVVEAATTLPKRHYINRQTEMIFSSSKLSLGAK